MIALTQLRVLISAVVNVETGSRAWDKATDALNDAFDYRDMLELVDRLQIVEEERDSLRHQLTATQDGAREAIMHAMILKGALKNNEMLKQSNQQVAKS